MHGNCMSAGDVPAARARYLYGNEMENTLEGLKARIRELGKSYVLRCHILFLNEQKRR